LKWRVAERPLAALRSLGPKSALILAEAGIRTIDELREIGAVKAYLRAKTLYPKKVSFNLLWGLAAGLEGRDWRDLTADEKVNCAPPCAGRRAPD
jgi:DNA transformation protein